MPRHRRGDRRVPGAVHRQRPLATQAAAALEELARKGRSYGIHLILASQTIAGVEALFTKGESIFGQFPLRVALAGGGGVLDHLNDAADNLPIGSAVINTPPGVPAPTGSCASPTPTRPRSPRSGTGCGTPARPATAPPAVFAGYAEHHLDDDPDLPPADPRRSAAARPSSAEPSTSACPPPGSRLDATPGRHIAVLGTRIVGADILHAAALSLARQHQPGTARSSLAALSPPPTTPPIDTAAAPSRPPNHLRRDRRRGEAARPPGRPRRPRHRRRPRRTYLRRVRRRRGQRRSSPTQDTDHLPHRPGRPAHRPARRPGRGVHVLGWWRGRPPVRRRHRRHRPAGGHRLPGRAQRRHQRARLPRRRPHPRLAPPPEPGPAHRPARPARPSSSSRSSVPAGTTTRPTGTPEHPGPARTPNRSSWTNRRRPADTPPSSHGFYRRGRQAHGRTAHRSLPTPVNRRHELPYGVDTPTAAAEKGPGDGRR